MKDFKYFKYTNLLVIGNGFDKDLGLPTTYKEFVSSRIWKRMYIQRSKENPKPSLIHYLYGRKYYDKWYDIETALLEYVQSRPDGSFVNNIEEDQKDYEMVCKALTKYLNSLFQATGENALKGEKKMQDSAAGKLLAALIRDDNSIIYSFNFTPINLIAKLVSSIDYIKKEPIRLHGFIKEENIINQNIRDSSIILGIETNDIYNIAPGYSFLLKSNRPEYKSSNLATDLIDSKNVIIFGHSLNQMDFGYYEDYFRTLISNTDKNRKLTIITKDEKSRIALLDNIRKMGFSVRDIFAHTSIDFILTTKLHNKEENEVEKFNLLLSEVHY